MVNNAKRRADELVTKFKTQAAARKRVNKIIREYGFRARILQVTDPKTKKRFFAVIKPKKAGLKKIR